MKNQVWIAGVHVSSSDMNTKLAVFDLSSSSPICYHNVSHSNNMTTQSNDSWVLLLIVFKSVSFKKNKKNPYLSVWQQARL